MRSAEILASGPCPHLCSSRIWVRAMIGKKFRARVTQDGTICAGNSTFALAISMEATPLLEKVSTYGLLPRLWLLIPINKEHKSILGGRGGAAAGGPVSIVLGNFRATFCGLVATSSNFCFSGQFLSKTMIGLEHISNTKKSTISQKTSSYAKFVSVNQPESKVQKGKKCTFG